MADYYGVTKEGFKLKRLDAIYNEVSGDIKNDIGVDISLHPQSILTTLVTSFCGQLAKSWELAEDIYFSMYPTSAEGVNLDNAMQYAGITRKSKMRSQFLFECTGNVGTTIRKAALVESVTQPTKQFQCVKDYTLSASNCIALSLSTNTLASGTVYTITVDGTQLTTYTATSGATQETIMNGLYSAVTPISGITVTKRDVVYPIQLIIESDDHTIDRAITVTQSLSPNYVTCNVPFESIEYGEIEVPYDTVTKIVTTITGFDGVTNSQAPILGRVDETDIEARMSYLERISTRSQNMLDSIVSAIYDNVDGVQAVTIMENTTNETDARGLSAHSVKVIVDGGENNEIAQQIYLKKAAGIDTNGGVVVNIPDDYGNQHTIRFARPTDKNVYFNIVVTLSGSATITAEQIALIKSGVIDYISQLELGESLYIQKMCASLYTLFDGINGIAITSKTTAEGSYTADTIIQAQTDERIKTESAKITVS